MDAVRQMGAMLGGTRGAVCALANSRLAGAWRFSGKMRAAAIAGPRRAANALDFRLTFFTGKI
jgi:hypothetical protein